MRIGAVPLPNPLVLAPMAGVTDLAFRLTARRGGCGLVTSEMVSAAGLCQGGRGSLAILRHAAEEDPLSVQLFGADPARMAQAARIAAEHGASIIDLNMGCPVRKVVRSGAGLALMRDPALAARIVRAVRDAVPIPVTIKIRSGPDARHGNAVPFARAMADAGADAITVHARFGGTRFATPADWSVIGEVARAVPVPVIGNGDVLSGRDARRMMEETGVRLVMIGRGALGRPWIFREILAHLEGRTVPPPTLEEIRRTVREHLALLCDLVPERAAVREFRKHLGWYSKGFPGGAQFRERAMRIESRARLEEHVDAFFGRPAPRARPGELGDAP